MAGDVRVGGLPTGAADETPLPTAGACGIEARWIGVWRTWLNELATNSAAALAASLAYGQLEAGARDRWLAALEQDAPRVDVPRIALYAPLLAVESDSVRRRRIIDSMGAGEEAARPSASPSAFKGVGLDEARVAVVIVPLYLDFVQVLACGYEPCRGFVWAKHDPMVESRAAPRAADVVQGVALEATPFEPLVDELAHAVVAHVRQGRDIPEALRVFADLFGPSTDSVPAT